MVNKGGDRVFGIDLIRVLATFFVVIVHAYTQNGWSGSFVYLGKKMLIGNFVISLSITAVPLFMMTTGYFLSKKGYSYKHLKTIPSLIFAVVSTSLLAGFVLKKFSFIDYGNDFVYRILTFQQNPYSWYIAIYIGTLFLVPFLNTLWANLNKKQHRILILTLLLLVGFSFLDYKNPLFTLWNPVYPFLYYFLGAYISKYQPKLKYTPILLLIAVVVTRALISIKIPIGGSTAKSLTENWGMLMSRYSVFTVIAAVCIFLILYQKETKFKFLRDAVRFVGERSLYIFLSSYIFDVCLIYRWKIMPDWPNLALFIPIISIVVFTLSLVLGSILKIIYDIIAKSVTTEIVPVIKSLARKRKSSF